ncbi:helix-turn-helix domain-containing protein [Hymenobacter sp. HMF4947]|uniref:Helix-turn-helix domain-containing protein n=1 Tax=Hymenobacter ginkgonis TaxID=2682976 RepID=A0A7K1T937_9BACT|nr:AraC family transcriptional regulator [Hymenobacter ginkgonis]MVN74812.1 helix-turn-helix domain-containing protein [Hymenobacter ginkgonis]
MPFSDLDYRVAQPPPALAELVESYWLLLNHSDSEQRVTLVPDGRPDVLFSDSATEPYHVALVGLDSQPSTQIIPPKCRMLAVSWKLLAVEYILPIRIADLLHTGRYLPADYLGITAEDFSDFDGFCAKISAQIMHLLPLELDARKRKLFNLLYASNGALAVEELATAAAWSSRQINRYFQQMFGLPLKAYSNILRFRASFQHLKAGKLFPEQNFADQAHFIREVKKYAGVVPKELARNQDDRFIQFAALPPPIVLC